MTDVVVIGGGPAGAACATELARAGASVVMVHDRRRHGWPGESLPPGSTGVVRRVFGDLLQHERGHRVTAGIRSAWGSPDLHETDYLQDPSDDAWILDRAVFDEDARAAATQAGASILHARAGAPERTRRGWLVPCSTGDAVSAALLVDATGRPARAARTLGMRMRRRDRLVALVAIGTATDERVGTIVEAVEEGWWYASIIGERVILAFLSDADLLPPPDQRAAFWRARLDATAHVRQAVHATAALPDPALHRADTAVGEPPYGPGWIAVGDAAAAWDPLSSQGLVAGMLLGTRAASAIMARSMRDWAEDLRALVDDTWSLQAAYYAQERRWPNVPFWQRRHAWLA